MNEQNRADPPPIVFLLDDDLSFLKLAKRWMEGAGLRVVACADVAAFLESLHRLVPDAICLDLHLGNRLGTHVLEQIQGIVKEVPVVMLTADSNAESVVAAMRLGAYDYLVKPVERERLRLTVAHAVEQRRMALRLTVLERESRAEAYAGIVGRSEPMSKLLREIDQAAPSDVPILISGDVGAGKSVIARAIHARSRRRMRRMATLDCAGVSASWHEPSLFGYERGAFRKAAARTKGIIDETDGGTLLIHEVSAIAPFAQGPLCALLEHGQFRRVGSLTPLRADVRVVATSCVDLRAEAEAARFRGDLYFRLTAFELQVPPLRARCDDIPYLAAAFLQQYSKQEGRPYLSLSSDALDTLMRWRWPGNVRELGNVLHQAFLTSQSGIIDVDDFPARLREVDAHPGGTEEAAPVRQGPSLPAPPVTLALTERAAILEALIVSRWNLSVAARTLGISRSTLYRKINAYRLVATPDLT